MKIVKLSVHKNTLEKRTAKELRARNIKYCKEVINRPDTIGIAVISWDKLGKVTTYTHIPNGSPITNHTLPETAKAVLIDRYVNT